MTADSYTQITGTPLSLGENEAAIYTTENDGTWHEVTLFGKSFSIAAWLPESPTGKHSAYSDREMILVVPDASTLEEVFQLQLQDESLSTNVYWEFSLDFDGAEKESVEALYKAIRQMTFETEGNYMVSCRPAQESEFYSMYGGLLFLGSFLGALFLMATVLIIYYKQISRSEERRVEKECRSRWSPYH